MDIREQLLDRTHTVAYSVLHSPDCRLDSLRHIYDLFSFCFVLLLGLCIYSVVLQFSMF